ncbi:MAG: cyclic nucleotide-binding domain-containing protein [candidate division KSB1 bacterium]|nr:cyclic nucleotide-binding domain-containing protein [candidate division KSB1 bacterium]
MGYRLLDRLESIVSGDFYEEGEKWELINSCPLFSGFGKRSLKALARHTYLRRLSADEVVYPIGSPAGALYFVLKGSVSLFQQKNGTMQPMRTVRQGSYFGESALFTTRDRRHGAVTLEESVLLALPKSDYNRLAVSSPETALKIMTILAGKFYQTLSDFLNEFRQLSREGAPDEVLS